MTVLSAFVALAGPVMAAQKQGQPKASTQGSLLDDEMLARFQAEHGCDDSAMTRAVQTTLDIEILSVLAAKHAQSRDMLDKGQQAATDMNRAAQAAADKGCPAIARKWWIYVIENFIGNGYAAMRQRAQIGIDDLRVAGQGKPAQ